ncbi:hypothetical protein NGB74_02595 [Staphylococcus chromogenes]|uniref:hypothetical protein n=1 Tax=Staphylococcus chromogenes TaxID=46126 RepID=UPI002DBC8195|nr:hypothetical protein [Staphylococcus chromogenes]MEB7449899.1 hypothetical protein [Staphylococcus chromogenes]
MLSQKYTSNPKTLFTVEIEEEITEETELPRLVEVLEYNKTPQTHLDTNKTIKSALDDSLDDTSWEPKAFYMLNDDMTMTLLWRNGGMVE